MRRKSALKLLGTSMSVFAVDCVYAPALYAGNSSWFPKIASDDDATKTGDIMGLVARKVTQGLTVLLFIVSVVMFIKFAQTISHGIEEAKKHEGGSLAVFANFAVMGMVYLSIGIGTAYIGYTMVSNFIL